MLVIWAGQLAFRIAEMAFGWLPDTLLCCSAAVHSFVHRTYTGRQQQGSTQQPTTSAQYLRPSQHSDFLTRLFPISACVVSSSSLVSCVCRRVVD